MKALGIDVGEKRIGLAVSDELGMLAAPLETIRRTSDAEAVDRISRVVGDHHVGEVVVGVPYQVDGSLGPQARKTMRFVEKLRMGVDVPVRLWDESLSTRQAEEGRLRKGKKSRAGGEKDRVAAAFILQEYLNASAKGGDGP